MISPLYQLPAPAAASAAAQAKTAAATTTQRQQTAPPTAGVAAVAPPARQHCPQRVELLLLAYAAPPRAGLWCCLVLGLLDTAHLPEAVLLLLELLAAPLHLLGQALADEPVEVR